MNSPIITQEYNPIKNKPLEPIYVIIYLRVSAEKQAKYWDSFEAQEEEARTFCKVNWYIVLAVFTERYTWTKDKRPTLQEAIEFVKKSELKISFAVVLKIDRISRWWIRVHESFKEQFEKVWVKVKDTRWRISEDKNVLNIEWINTNKYDWAKDTTNKISENLEVMFAEIERTTILQRMIWQSMRNSKKWYKINGDDYGYKNAKIVTESWRKKTIQVEREEESKFIKKMYELKVRWDLTEQKIVDEINLIGYKSRTRVKWNEKKDKQIGTIWWISLDVEQLRTYIANPIYAWVTRYKRSWYKPMKTPYDWLVSIELWNRANKWKAKIVKNNDWSVDIEYYTWESKVEAPIIKKRKNYNPDSPFWKMLECPECWWHLTTERCRSKSWKYHHYYSCRWRKGIKHKNYALKRDVVNETIIDIFSNIKFNEESIEIFKLISSKIYKDRKNEHNEKSILITSQIQALKAEQKSIITNIQNIIAYPDLLEAQNKKVQNIKQEIIRLEKEKNYTWEKIWLARFNKCSIKIFEHLENLVKQRQNPLLIQLGFDIIFNGKVQFKDLNFRTPKINSLSLLEAKKEFQKNWNSNLNPKWLDSSENYRILYKWIESLIDKIDKWQYEIDSLESYLKHL